MHRYISATHDYIRIATTLTLYYVIYLAISFGLFLSIILPPPDVDVSTLCLALLGTIQLGSLYFLWRYVGPAAIEIERLKLERRIVSPPNDIAATMRYASWESPWLALPAVAFCGLAIATAYGLFDLAPLAIPVAVFFAHRHGRAALLPLSLGTFPFLLTLTFNSVSTAGGLWPAAAIIFWANFTARPDFRTNILQHEKLRWSDLTPLIIVLAPIYTYTLGSPYAIKIAIGVNPSFMLATIVVVIAMSRMSVGRLVVGLLVATLLSEYFNGLLQESTWTMRLWPFTTTLLLALIARFSVIAFRRAQVLRSPSWLKDLIDEARVGNLGPLLPTLAIMVCAFYPFSLQFYPKLVAVRDFGSAGAAALFIGLAIPKALNRLSALGRLFFVQAILLISCFFVPSQLVLRQGTVPMLQLAIAVRPIAYCIFVVTVYSLFGYFLRVDPQLSRIHEE